MPADQRVVFCVAVVSMAAEGTAAAALQLEYDINMRVSITVELAAADAPEVEDVVEGEEDRVLPAQHPPSVKFSCKPPPWDFLGAEPGAELFSPLMGAEPWVRGPGMSDDDDAKESSSVFQWAEEKAIVMNAEAARRMASADVMQMVCSMYRTPFVEGEEQHIPAHHKDEKGKGGKGGKGAAPDAAAERPDTSGDVQFSPLHLPLEQLFKKEPKADTESDADYEARERTFEAHFLAGSEVDAVSAKLGEVQDSVAAAAISLRAARIANGDMLLRKVIVAQLREAENRRDAEEVSLLDADVTMLDGNRAIGDTVGPTPADCSARLVAVARQLMTIQEELATAMSGVLFDACRASVEALEQQLVSVKAALSDPSAPAAAPLRSSQVSSAAAAQAASPPPSLEASAERVADAIVQQFTETLTRARKRLNVAFKLPDGVGNGGGPSGLSSVRVCLELDRPFLTHDLASAINPMIVTVASGRQMPPAPKAVKDIVLPSCAEYSFFSLYRPSVMAAAAVAEDAVEGVTISNPPTTLVATPRLSLDASSGDIHWKHQKVFLAGLFDSQEFRKFLSASELHVAVRDRDILLAPPANPPIFPGDIDENVTATLVESGDSFRVGFDGAVHTVEWLDAAPTEVDIAPLTFTSVEGKVGGRVTLSNGSVFRNPPLLAATGPQGQAAFSLTDLLRTRHVSLSADVTPAHGAFPAKEKILWQKAIPGGGRSCPVRTPYLDPDFGSYMQMDVWTYEAVEQNVAKRDALEAAAAAALAANADAAAVADEGAAAQAPSGMTSYERAVFVMPYNEFDVLPRLLHAVAVENCKSLGIWDADSGVVDHHALSLGKVSTPEDATPGTPPQDAITGIQIIDDNKRFLVLEGLTGGTGVGADSEGAMATVRKAVFPNGNLNNGSSITVLSNPKIRFPDRLYARFGTEMRHVKLAEPLKRTMAKASTYHRAKLTSECHTGLVKMQLIQEASGSGLTEGHIRTLHDAMKAFCFPTAAMVVAVDRAFGMFVSIPDETGVPPHHDLQSHLKSALVKQESVGSLKAAAKAAEVHRLDKLKIKLATSYKMPTDSKNPSYIKARSEYVSPDFIESNIKAVAGKARDKLPDDLKPVGEDGKPMEVSTYPASTLSHVELQKASVRERLQGDKKAGYPSFTPDSPTLAQSFTLGDTDGSFGGRTVDKSRWMTEKGFQYPQAAPPLQFGVEHREPRNPVTGAGLLTESRVSDLKTEWVEKDTSIHLNNGATKPPAFANGKEFKTIAGASSSSTRHPSDLLPKRLVDTIHIAGKELNRFWSLDGETWLGDRGPHFFLPQVASALLRMDVPAFDAYMARNLHIKSSGMTSYASKMVKMKGISKVGQRSGTSTAKTSAAEENSLQDTLPSSGSTSPKSAKRKATVMVSAPMVALMLHDLKPSLEESFLAAEEGFEAIPGRGIAYRNPPVEPSDFPDLYKSVFLRQPSDVRLEADAKYAAERDFMDKCVVDHLTTKIDFGSVSKSKPDQLSKLVSVRKDGAQKKSLLYPVHGKLGGEVAAPPVSILMQGDTADFISSLREEDTSMHIGKQNFVRYIGKQNTFPTAPALPQATMKRGGSLSAALSKSSTRS